MKTLVKTFLAWMLLAVSMNAMAQKNPDVGGAAMSPKKMILEGAAASPIHHRFVEAIKAAGLEDTLNGKGPFTVFAPTDDAFAKLPQGTFNNLMKPENKAALTKILAYHVVPEKISSKQISKRIKKGHGTASLKTLEGGVLTAKRVGSLLTLTDEKGGISFLTTPDIFQKNGVIHVVDAILMPN